MILRIALIVQEEIFVVGAKTHALLMRLQSLWSVPYPASAPHLLCLVETLNHAHQVFANNCLLTEISLMLLVKNLVINSRLMGEILAREDAIDFRVFVDSPDSGGSIQSYHGRN